MSQTGQRQKQDQDISQSNVISEFRFVTTSVINFISISWSAHQRPPDADSMVSRTLAEPYQNLTRTPPEPTRTPLTPNQNSPKSHYNSTTTKPESYQKPTRTLLEASQIPTMTSSESYYSLTRTPPESYQNPSRTLPEHY